MRDTAARLLGLPAEQVRVVFTRGSGLLRHQRRRHGDLRRGAALAGGRPAGARAADATRRDGVGELRQRLRHRSARRARRVGHHRRVGLRGVVAGARRAARLRQPRQRRHRHARRVRAGGVAPRTPAPAPATPLNNGLNTAPSYVTGCVGGVCSGTGTVRSERVLSHRVASPFFTGPLRAPERFQNTFAHESFMDEIAARRQGRPGGVPSAAPARRAPAHRGARGRGAPPSGRRGPRRVRAPRGPASRAGRGISCVLYEGDNGYVAIVAEVEVDQATGVITVTPARRRAGLRPDLEPRRREEPVRRRRAARHEPRALRRGDLERPDGDVDRLAHVPHVRGRHANARRSRAVLVDQPTAEANGAGETAITAVAAAIGNAVFDATGARLREIPFTPDRVKAAWRSGHGLIARDGVALRSARGARE